MKYELRHAHLARDSGRTRATLFHPDHRSFTSEDCFYSFRGTGEADRIEVLGCSTHPHAAKKALNKSRIDRTQREEDINAYVKAFEEETKRLDEHFDHHKSTVADVESVLQRASRINTFMILHPLDARVQGDWATLRADLELLGNAYNISLAMGRRIAYASFRRPALSRERQRSRSNHSPH